MRRVKPGSANTYPDRYICSCLSNIVSPTSFPSPLSRTASRALFARDRHVLASNAHRFAPSERALDHFDDARPSFCQKHVLIENEAVVGFNKALNKSVPISTTIPPQQFALDAGNTTNRTVSLTHTLGLANATAPRLPYVPSQPVESFYRQLLPRETFIFVVLSVLYYWWHIFLERILPARPKSQSVPSEKEVEHSEDHEEEVVKKWVAQGRVRRSSLNWCNTFLKWVLEMTVGRLWYHSVGHGVRTLLKTQDPTLPLSGLKGVSHLSSFCIFADLTLRHQSISW
jgi:hypothetical protein